MVINLHAGHNPDGKIACGACGIIKESTEARMVKDIVISTLKSMGHTVYDCTCDNGTSQSDVLNKIVAKCNEHTVDLDVSIHFNAGGGHGTEVLVYDLSNNSPVAIAERITKSIEALGFRNRGIKKRPELAVLCRTKAPALLIECCFVDSDEDCRLYSPAYMANAIVKGITGQEVKTESDVIYRVQVGAFKYRENAELMLKDLESKGIDGFIVEVKK